MTDIRTTAKPGPTFDAESMRAIRDGRKTQTRRVLKGYREGDWPFALPRGLACDRIAWQGGYSTPLPYRVGGVYYARESLYCDGIGRNTYYMADGSGLYHESGLPRPWPWKCRVLAPHLMPRWAARVWLRIVDVRVQRLRETSIDDAVAEGVPMKFAVLWPERWEQVNGKGSWARDRNKWVAAYTFEVLQGDSTG